MGNRVAAGAPHGIYHARGDDRWIALSVVDDVMWTALVGVEGLEFLAADERFRTGEGRIAHQDELDDLVSGWTNRRTDWEGATELQAAGVAAAPVLDSWDLLSDPQLAARDFFRLLPSARFGQELVFGPAVVLSETT